MLEPLKDHYHVMVSLEPDRLLECLSIPMVAEIEPQSDPVYGHTFAWPEEAAQIGEPAQDDAPAFDAFTEAWKRLTATEQAWWIEQDWSRVYIQRTPQGWQLIIDRVK